MGNYAVRRLLLAVPTLLGVATASFILIRILPGDPARVLAGANATQHDIQLVRHQFGLDKPLWDQYGHFMGQLFTGDLGRSARTGQSVMAEITARLPNTVYLAVLATLVAVVVGCAMGLLAAVRRERPTDVLLSGLSVMGVSMPVYWIGLLLVIVFSVNLRWFPAAGMGGWRSFVLPTVALSFFAIGFISRQTRSAMVETLDLDFIRTLRARGLARWVIVLRHALRNAALPIITVVGLQFGQLLGGAVITETIFAWPGMGRLLVESIESRDYAAVQGCIIIFAVGLILVNIVTDLVYAYVDPRIRYD